jgi:hypothetical protein
MTYLEIEYESRYLLRQPKEVDSSIKKGRFKFLLQVNLTPIFEVFRFSSHVHQKDNMDSELKQNREKDVKVEDVSERSFLG